LVGEGVLFGVDARSGDEEDTRARLTGDDL